MPRPVSSRTSRVIAAAAAALLLVSVVPGLAAARASHPMTRASHPVARASAASDPDHDGLDSSFEVHWSLTDPSDPDSNHDGIQDGREDPDADHLSNLWEQRLGLDPRSADTDGDGNPDGSEDRDHDRLTNRFEVHVTRTDPRTGGHGPRRRPGRCRGPRRRPSVQRRRAALRHRPADGRHRRRRHRRLACGL